MYSSKYTDEDLMKISLFFPIIYFPVVCTLASLTQNGQLLGGQGVRGQAHDLNLRCVEMFPGTDESPALAQWASGYYGGVPVLFTFLLRFTWFLSGCRHSASGEEKRE